MRIERIEALSKKSVANFRVMIVGEVDTGKTTIAASCVRHEDMRPALFLDVDRRLTTLAETEYLYRTPVGRTGKKTTIKDVESVMSVLGEPRRRWPEEIRGVKTIILDSISRLKDNILYEMAVDDSDIKGRSNRSRDDIFANTQRDYGRMSTLINQLIRVLVNTDCHLFILSHNRDIFVESRHGVGDGVLYQVQPELNPKVRRGVVAYMNSVWYTRKKDEKTYELLTLPNGVYDVKATNPMFSEALAELTTRNMSEAASSKNRGWVSVPYCTIELPNTIAELWDLYKGSVINE